LQWHNSSVTRPFSSTSSMHVHLKVQLTHHDRCRSECRKGKGEQIVSNKQVNETMNDLIKKLYSIGGNKMVGVACLAIIRVILHNYQGRLQGQLFETAFLKRVPEFFHILVRNIGICVASSAVQSTRQYLLDALAIQWRGWVTDLLHAKYFSRMVREPSLAACTAS
jgi:ABC-type uncharacterized transport system fused permease/ATPase subunit